MKTKLLSVDDIRDIVDNVGLDSLMDELTEKIADTCSRFDETRYSVPVRGGFHNIQPHTGLIEWQTQHRCVRLDRLVR